MATLEEFLNKKNCFKLICGAGNENLEEVEYLVKLYYEAGCRFFDLCMSQEVLDVAKSVAPDAKFCLSFGIKSDPHTKKCRRIEEKCRHCGKCYSVCFDEAIDDVSRCVGCMRCFKACRYGAIEVSEKTIDLEEVLPTLYGYDCLELHCSASDDDETFKNWEIYNKNFDGMLSICMDRSKLSNEAYLGRIRKMIDGRKPYTTIIQADGAPMSGGADDYKTTLQAVAMAEIVQNAGLPVYTILSGGTNSKSLELANLCGLNVNGVGIGSYARKIVKDLPYTEALQVAKTLINKVRQNILNL